MYKRQASDGAGVKLKRSIGTPEADYIDPFLMLDEFGSENKDDYVAGFPPHPHRGIETVTYMLQGKFEHEDSTGSKGKMTAGDVQWMKTGRGIIHSEMNTPAVQMAYANRLFLKLVNDTGAIGRVATKPTQAMEDGINAGLHSWLLKGTKF